MTRRLLIFAIALLTGWAHAGSHYELADPPHDYWNRPLTDRFTKLKAELESGKVQLDTTSGEKATLLSLLKLLDIPVSSQMLVFSTTSLQLRLISARNPRALFFNEDVYVGFIPGGRIEVVSVDPAAGGIYYIFDIPRGAQAPVIERSTRCMNCHAREDTFYVPGLVVKSVLPGQSGGSLNAFRQGLSGHGIPYADRFGGWYVTGKHGITQHWGNLFGLYRDGKIVNQPIEPGRYFDYDRYPVASSDVLPQLIHEHQIGFANRTIEAAYAARQVLEVNNAQPSPEQLAELDAKARALTRYLLFADEPPLPPGGVEGDPAFKNDFLATKRAVSSAGGSSLKDFDLKTRMFRYRCSYMIYSNVFQGLPGAIKERVYRRLGEALNTKKPDPEYAYLPAEEKLTIHAILKGTLKDLPAGW